MTSKTRLLDRTAVTLSALCIIHCVMLPLVATGLPLLGLVAESEWVHRSFVILAVPISAYVFLKPRPANQGSLLLLRLLVAVGILLLILGAFVEALHDHEVILTVIGACMVATAHILHSRRHVHA